MCTEPSSKRSKLTEIMKIGTHNGTFHCDEVFACFMLRQLPEYKDAEIIRSRDSSKLSECDIVVDVGGVYDPSIHRYDHHQRSFSESLSTVIPGKIWKTKLSSAGLIYAHFGKHVLLHIIEKEPNKNESDLKREVNKEMIEVLYDKIYEKFVEEVDAIDNGVDISTDAPRYSINSNLSSRVAYLNPSWCDSNGKDEEYQFERFMKAYNMVGEEFVDRVKYFSNVWWPARMIVKEAMEQRFQVDGSGEIMLMARGSCPWKDHLQMLEDEEKLKEKGDNADRIESKSLKYVLYPDTNNSWRVQCVPAEKHSFENRLSLPKPWRGLRDEELSKQSGIDGCIFVHSSGFIGGHKSMDGALAMARKALSLIKGN